MSEIPEDFDADFDERPSKSQKKRDMHDLQALGADLLTLPESRLEPLDLPEILRDAIRDAKKISNFEGKRRQLQYIGKLMRKVDPEPIREAVAAFKLGHAQDSLALHEAERWRERLLDNDEALQAFISEFAGVDVQQLRSLVRSARKDLKTPKPADQEQRHGRAYRELFQLIKAELKRTSREAGDDTGSDDDDDGDES
ncbi:ribosome biogenesis factor YjgA [Acidovorax soli]|uniref:ribosome biogenesis factor YjgA n=1 Tax=Acidovorax soli TaxID=592050 RepID=UPI0032B2C8C9